MPTEPDLKTMHTEPDMETARTTNSNNPILKKQTDDVDPKSSKFNSQRKSKTYDKRLKSIASNFDKKSSNKKSAPAITFDNVIQTTEP